MLLNLVMYWNTNLIEKTNNFLVNLIFKYQVKSVYIKFSNENIFKAWNFCSFKNPLVKYWRFTSLTSCTLLQSHIVLIAWSKDEAFHTLGNYDSFIQERTMQCITIIISASLYQWPFLRDVQLQTAT